MTTDSTARILEEIVLNIKYEANNINIKNYIFRKLDKDYPLKDPDNQVEGFLGEGLPKKTPLWSKAGLMSKVRHDAALWSHDTLNSTLLIVFGNNPFFAKDKLFFPQLSSAVYEFNSTLFI